MWKLLGVGVGAAKQELAARRRAVFPSSFPRPWFLIPRRKDEQLPAAHRSPQAGQDASLQGLFRGSRRGHGA